MRANVSFPSERREEVVGSLPPFAESCSLSYETATDQWLASTDEPATWRRPGDLSTEWERVA